MSVRRSYASPVEDCRSLHRSASSRHEDSSSIAFKAPYGGFVSSRGFHSRGQDRYNTCDFLCCLPFTTEQAVLLLLLKVSVMMMKTRRTDHDDAVLCWSALDAKRLTANRVSLRKLVTDTCRRKNLEHSFWLCSGIQDFALSITTFKTVCIVDR